MGLSQAGIDWSAVRRSPKEDGLSPDPSDEFRDFVQTRSRELLRVAWLLTGDWQTSQDLVQTALAATWRRWGDLTRRDMPELYVRKVMVNTYRRWRRRRWRNEIPVDRLPEFTAVPLSDIELRQSLLRALDKLTPRQRAVLTLRYLDDRTESQVAQILGCSISTVKAHTSQAFTRLRSMPSLAALLIED
jgi:RNA polymerase sigma-70 factor (sigma-E family)